MPSDRPANTAGTGWGETGWSSTPAGSGGAGGGGSAPAQKSTQNAQRVIAMPATMINPYTGKFLWQDQPGGHQYTYYIQPESGSVIEIFHGGHLTPGLQVTYYDTEGHITRIEQTANIVVEGKPFFGVGKDWVQVRIENGKIVEVPVKESDIVENIQKAVSERQAQSRSASGQQAQNTQAPIMPFVEPGNRATTYIGGPFATPVSSATQPFGYAPATWTPQKLVSVYETPEKRYVSVDTSIAPAPAGYKKTEGYIWLPPEPPATPKVVPQDISNRVPYYQVNRGVAEYELRPAYHITMQEKPSFPVMPVTPPPAVMTAAPSLVEEQRAKRARYFEGAKPERVIGAFGAGMVGTFVSFAAAVKTITWDVPINLIANPVDYSKKLYTHWTEERIPSTIAAVSEAVTKTLNFGWTAEEVSGAAGAFVMSYGIGKMISPFTQPVVSDVARSHIHTTTEAEVSGFIYQKEVVPGGVKYTSTLSAESTSIAYARVMGSEIPLGSATATATGTQQSIVLSSPQTYGGGISFPVNVIGTTYGKMAVGGKEIPFVESGGVSFLSISSTPTFTARGYLPYSVTYGVSQPTPEITYARPVPGGAEPIFSAGERLGVTYSFYEAPRVQKSSAGLLSEMLKVEKPYGEITYYRHTAMSGTDFVQQNIKILDITGQTSYPAREIFTGGGGAQEQVFGSAAMLGSMTETASKTAAQTAAQSNIATTLGTGAASFTIATGGGPIAKTETRAGGVAVPQDITKTMPTSQQSAITKTMEMPTITDLSKQNESIRNKQKENENIKTNAAQLPEITVRQLPITATRETQKEGELIKTIPITTGQTLTKQLPMEVTIQQELTRITPLTAEQQQTPQTTIILPPPPPQIQPPPPPPIITGSSIFEKIQTRVFGKQPVKYTPSMTAAVFNIKGNINTKRMFTGLEIRPIKLKW